MKQWYLLLIASFFLFSCGGKNYPIVEHLLDFYEEVYEQYEEAESRQDLENIRKEARQKLKQIEKEQVVSHNELIHDIEQYDEDAYLLHLELLTKESHTQWMYMKMKRELENKK